jgi:hypothetical protein
VDAGEERQAERRDRDASSLRRLTRTRKSASAISGISTTYRPTMNPADETDVRWRPVVWRT